MTKAGSEAAFGALAAGPDGSLYDTPGLTKREYAAIYICAGLMSHASGEAPEKAPAVAVTIADALFIELEKDAK